ncbi:hypothetical protein [Brucella suis]|uniref:hypothetical protein n=1 Tax=Brucella suis TaxID=29461 RepID=UPI000D9A4EB2|nr:hypothetical protein [Brucella suis]SPU72290.1 Uncharacterised protein [Brucella suis]
MAIQTVSDELYRRHEREWAEFRNAVEASETNQKQQGQASGKTSCDSKPEINNLSVCLFAKRRFKRRFLLPVRQGWQILSSTKLTWAFRAIR